jgi:hypothetical protein
MLSLRAPFTQLVQSAALRRFDWPVINLCARLGNSSPTGENAVRSAQNRMAYQLPGSCHRPYIIAKSVREADTSNSKQISRKKSLYCGRFFDSATFQLLENLSDETELNSIALFCYAFVNTPFAIDAHR